MKLELDVLVQAYRLDALHVAWARAKAKPAQYVKNFLILFEFVGRCL